MTRKFSSCSTIFIDDSTVSQPNLKNTIRAVALAVYFHIKNRNRGINGSVYPPDEHDDRLVEIFDEKLHPLSVRTISEHYVTCWREECRTVVGVGCSWLTSAIRIVDDCLTSQHCLKTSLHTLLLTFLLSVSVSVILQVSLKSLSI